MAETASRRRALVWLPILEKKNQFILEMTVRQFITAEGVAQISPVLLNQDEDIY